jgi:hypothetical protein
MEMGGNKRVNKAFEALLGGNISLKPCPRADLPSRERFIKEKYDNQSYLDKDVLLAMMKSNDAAKSKLIKDMENMGDLKECSGLFADFAGMSQEDLFSDSNFEMFHEGCVRVESNMDLLRGSKMETFGSSRDDFVLLQPNSKQNMSTGDCLSTNSKKQTRQRSQQDDMDVSPLVSPIADGSRTKQMEREASWSDIYQSGEHHDTVLKGLKPDDTIILLKDGPEPVSRTRRAVSSESVGFKSSRHRLPQSSGRSRSLSRNRRSDGKRHRCSNPCSNSKGALDARSDHEPMVRGRRSCNPESLDTKSSHEPMVRVHRRSCSQAEESLDHAGMERETRSGICVSGEHHDTLLQELEPDETLIILLKDGPEPSMSRDRRAVSSESVGFKSSHRRLAQSSGRSRSLSRNRRSDNKSKARHRCSNPGSDSKGALDARSDHEPMVRGRRSCNPESLDIKSSHEPMVRLRRTSSCSQESLDAGSSRNTMVRVRPSSSSQESFDVKCSHEPRARICRSSNDEPLDIKSNHELTTSRIRRSSNNEPLEIKSNHELTTSRIHRPNIIKSLDVDEPTARIRRSNRVLLLGDLNSGIQPTTPRVNRSSNNDSLDSKTEHSSTPRNGPRSPLLLGNPSSIKNPPAPQRRDQLRRAMSTFELQTSPKATIATSRTPRVNRSSNKDSLDSKSEHSLTPRNGPRSPILPGNPSSVKTPPVPYRRDQLRRTMSSFELQTSQKATIVPSPVSKERDDEIGFTASNNSSFCDDSEVFASSNREPMVRVRRTCNQETTLDAKSRHEPMVRARRSCSQESLDAVSSHKPMVRVRPRRSYSQESLDVKSSPEPRATTSTIRRSSGNESPLEESKSNQHEPTTSRIRTTLNSKKSLDVNELTARRNLLLNWNSGRQSVTPRVNGSSSKDSLDSKSEHSPSTSRNACFPPLLGSPSSIKPLAPPHRDQRRERSTTSFEIKTASQKVRTIAPSPISKCDDETGFTKSLLFCETVNPPPHRDYCP